MGGCRRHCPRGRLRPRTGRCRSRRPRGGRPAVRVLPARPVLRVALRLLRLQHLHRQGARRRWRRRRRTPRPRSREVRLARRVLKDLERPVETVFFGGGTPTLLPAKDLGAMLDAVRDEFGLAPDAEVTTEANPESVDPQYLEELREAGFTRVSFGMQSASSHVLQDPRSPAHARPRLAGGEGGDRGRVRARQSRPDLRHARASRSTTGGPRWSRRCRPIPITSAPTR